MNREELEEFSRLQYTFEEIYSSAGFRAISREVVSDGRTVVTTWQRTIGDATYEFQACSEDEPALLMTPLSQTVSWSKLDLIRLLHADTDWNIAKRIVEAGELLGDRPLAPLRNQRQIEIAKEMNSIAPEERTLFDSAFSREYSKQMIQQRARRIAQRDLDEDESKAAQVDLASLTQEELKERLGVIDWSALWTDDTEELWLVPGFLCAGRGHMLYAPSGLGKSLLCLEIAACLASGRGVWGHSPQEPIRVLYLDQENSPRGDIRPRLLDMGFRDHDLEKLIYLSFPDVGALNHEAGGSYLEAIIEIYQPHFIFFDTFSRFVDADENLARTVQDFYAFTGRILKKRGIGYMRLDHTGKNTAVGARGTSAKTDDLDLIWAMSEDSTDNTYLLTNEKQRTPVPEAMVRLSRHSDPLRHEVAKLGFWSEMLIAWEKLDRAVDLLRTLKDRDPANRLARGRTWEELRSECQRMGISRKLLFEAIDYYKKHELVS